MARVTSPGRTGLSGKSEGLVYFNLNGQTYSRSLPHFKKDSITPGMRLNRQRFKKVNEFCALFKDSLIPQIWNGRDDRMSGYSLFLKTNKSAFASDGTMEDIKKIKLSTGNLSFPPGFEAQRSQIDENRVEVNWPKQLNVGGVHLKDQLMVVSESQGEYSGIQATGIKRNDLKGSFVLPSSPVSQVPGSMHVFLFFASKDHREYSKSECFEV